MPEQAKTGFSPSTGQYFVKLPGNVVREVTQAQAELINSDPGMVSNIIGSAVETGKNLLLGGASLLAPEYEQGLAKQALVPGQQEMVARSMVAPVSSMVGAAVPQVAADVAGFALGGVPGAIAAGALTGAAGSPEAPMEGAAIGGAFGALPALMPAARMVAPRMADRVFGKIDEATATAPRAPLGVSEDMANFTRDAESLGLRVPPSVKYQSQTMENVGLTLESNPLTSWMTGGAGRHNQAQLTNIARQATGIADNAPLTPAVLRAAEQQTANQFRQVADFAGTSATKADIKSAIESSLEESFVGKGKFLKKVDTLLNDFKSDTLDANNLMRFQSSLGDLGRRAKGETRGQIGSARDSVIDMIPANQAMADQYRLAREQWAAQRALLDAVGQRGVVRAGSLAKRLSVSGANQNTPIGKLAKAAEVVHYMRPSAYGTENARRGGLTGMVMPAVAGGLGVNQIFGK